MGEPGTSIAGDLPDRHLVWRVIQDHVNPNLLFAGTEFGIFFTVNGGEKWIKLKGGVPTIPFRDLEIQRRENDLVGASFGRSFYILDDYTPLRTVSEESLADEDFTLFSIHKTQLYIPSRPLGSTKGSQGDDFFAASNPGFGATFTCYLKEALTTQQQQRAKREGEISKTGGDVSPPDWESLRQEEREEGPVLQFTVSDADGNLVQRIIAPATAGFQRVAWDLRYASLTGQGNGPLVAPGTYSVRAAQRVGDEFTPLGEEQTFEVVAIGNPTLPDVDRQEALAFQTRAGDLQRAVIAADRTLVELLERVRAIKQVARESNRVPDEMYETAREIELALLDLQVDLRGDSTREERSQESTPSILSRIQLALGETLSQTHGPTQTFREQLDIARTDFAKARDTLSVVLAEELQPLERRLDELGAPWTPGRPVPVID